MTLQKEFFRSSKDLWLFLGIALFLFTCKVGFLYYRYTSFISQKTPIVQGIVLKQYTKTKHNRTYQVLKLKTTSNLTIYTTASKNFKNIQNRFVTLKLYPKHISFLDYLRGFYAKGWFLHVKSEHLLRSTLQKNIANQHKDPQLQQLYNALFLAYPLPYKLYQHFGSLGVTHLFAISGLHLGIITGVVFFLLSFLYTPFHKHFFPYQNKKRDIFLLTALVLFFYLEMLNYPPSLLRSYGMMVTGFVLYDRGYKIISLQTLFITAAILLILDPRLFFSYGFWLSVLGVFYILLFLIHFPHLSFVKQLFLIPVWVYFMMLPTSLYLFGTFSLYHPFSIFLSIVFGIFYPLSLFLHLIGFGDLFDPFLNSLLSLKIFTCKVFLPTWVEMVFLFLSLWSIKNKKILFLLFGLSLFIFFYALFEYYSIN